MKKFKMKNLYVVLILVLSLALSACSDSDDKEKNQVVDDVTTTNLDVESGSGETTKDDVTTDGDETSGSDETTKNGETETSTEEITTTEGDTTTETSVEQTTTSEEQEECAHSFGDWKVTKEATCSKEGTKQRACTKCSHTETVGVPTIAHTEVKDAAVEATCTEAGKTEGKHCSVCNKIIVKQETIKANGHKEVTVSGKVPTESESGLTDGKKCSKCGVITVAQITIAPYIESCNDDYGYKDLAKQSKGTAKQSMYTRMDELAKQFHTSKTMNAKDNIAFSVAFADLGLTVDEAVQVWITYKNDHPLYYWM